MKSNVFNGLNASTEYDSDEESSKKGIQYTREWNTVDFVGKYHLSKFANKVTSLPGTQVQVERDHITAKQNEIKEREEYLNARLKRTNEMLRIKGESAEVNTRIYFDTIIGQPIQQAEDILKERDEILNEIPVMLDTKKDIDRYFKNVALGRHHYIGFAASAGFRSISYADLEYGNTPLHIAVKKGHIETTEELLKYNADRDAMNRLGNRPIHEAWFFWKTHSNRTKEERLAQETTTCELLLRLLSYGTCPDSQDQSGQTPLHIACRLGPARAVKIILSFQADTTQRTKAGLTAAEIAVKHGQEETYKLLVAWEHISHELVRLDFHAIWHRFLCDYTQVISSHKSAEAILAEIEMSCSVGHMERTGVSGGAVQIDDPLLKAAYEASKLCSHTPKPWEGTEWAAFVKKKKAEGTLDLKHQLENLQRQRMGYKVRKGGAAAGSSGAGIKKSSGVVTSPDKPKPTPKPRLLLPLSTIPDSHSSSNSNNNNSNTSSSSQSNLATTKANSATNLAENKECLSERSQEQSEGDDTSTLEKDVYAVQKTDYGKIQDYTTSALGQRRLHLAHKVARDAKFLSFTKRLTTSSVLLLPLRTPHAPHVGTEEEGDRMRAIVSQGPDYDKFEKYKKVDRFAELVGLRPEPRKNTLGAYSEECEFAKPNPRDQLYEKLALTTAEKLASMALVAAASENINGGGSHPGSRANSRPGTSTGSRPGTSSLLGAGLRGKVVLEVDRKEKIDLVQDRRPRYVSAELLPAARPLSLVEQLSKQDEQRQTELLRKKQGLGTQHGVAAAREEMERAIASSQEHVLGELADAEVSGVKRKMMAEKEVAMRKLFLQKETVKYGEGRITSTHNCKGKIEEPWVTTKGRYSTTAGDRTA